MDDRELAYVFKTLELSVARLDKKINFILAELKLQYPDEQELHPELDQVMALLKKGNLVGAIQEYRKVTGAPFEEARAQVQALNVKLK